MKTMGTPTRVDDLIASYSSKGPTAIDAIAKPDIVAPGNLLVSLEAPGSTLYNEYPADRVPYSYYVNGGSSASSYSYFTLSGTSMATGVVSGVVADLLQQSPNLNPDQVKARLMKTAWKTFPTSSSVTDPSSGITYTDQYDVFTVGAGYVDLEAALLSTDVATRTAMSPTVTYNTTSGKVYLAGDPSAVWNTSATWASTSVWGPAQFIVNPASSQLSGTYALWGSNAPWGSNALWGSYALWGSNTTWGSNALWGSYALWGSNVSGGEN